MHNELFNENRVYTHNKNISKSIEDRDKDPYTFLEKAFETKNHKAIGLKLFPDHMRRNSTVHKLFDNVLVDNRIKKIILYRENHLAVCTSMLRSAVTGHYTHKNLDSTNVSFSANEFQEFINSYDEYYEYINENCTNKLNITYEDLIRDIDGTLRKICDFLGVEYELTETSSKKQSTKTLEESISNYSELDNTFAFTRYKKYFV